MIDLSENGAQPKHSAAIASSVFNGEIYNHNEILTEFGDAGPFA
ncbi:MAG: hypothetical protein Ct9H300mP4_13280 [Gammaproteobacteria bacterium]|nr:MAG: hypothetical protein Ct9H300mP4_13280 [Gammaproteobacteria bacterium]